MHRLRALFASAAATDGDNGVAAGGRRGTRKRRRRDGVPEPAGPSGENGASEGRAAAGLGGLPPEVQLCLGAWLSLADLCRLAATSRAMRSALAAAFGPARLADVDPLGALRRDLSESIASRRGWRALCTALAARRCVSCGTPTLNFLAIATVRLCTSCFTAGTCGPDCPESRVVTDTQPAAEVPGDGATDGESDRASPAPHRPQPDALTGLLHRARTHKFDVVEKSVALSAFLLDDGDLAAASEICLGLSTWIPSQEAFAAMQARWGSADGLRSELVRRRMSRHGQSEFPILGRDARVDAELGYVVVMNQFSFRNGPDIVVVPPDADPVAPEDFGGASVVASLCDTLDQAVALAAAGSTILIPRGVYLEVADPVELWRSGLRVKGETKAEYRTRMSRTAVRKEAVSPKTLRSRIPSFLAKIFGAGSAAAPSQQVLWMPPPAHLHCAQNAAIVVTAPCALENLVVSSGGVVTLGIPAVDDPSSDREDFAAHYPAILRQRAGDEGLEEYFSAATVDSVASIRECRFTADRGSCLVARKGAQLDVASCEFVNGRCAGVCITGTGRLARFAGNRLVGNGTWAIQAARAIDQAAILAQNVVAGNQLGAFYM
ncbi:hypothetical protein DFJ74DRAFT_644815 [Hyaloraphidium curvatum]|nr:hypothetical protein DFJ74DRAFT_644815 [Hyaloraphidium curvatum]